MPINKWTVTTATLGGAVLGGRLLLTMNYNHPFTTEARLYFITSHPSFQRSKGRVIEVPVKPNVELKQG